MRYYAKLHAIKNEWEVARIYSDGRWQAAQKTQSGGWERITFHMAPLLLSKPDEGSREEDRIRRLDLQGLKLMLASRACAVQRWTSLGKTVARRMRASPRARVKGVAEL